MPITHVAIIKGLWSMYLVGFIAGYCISPSISWFLWSLRAIEAHHGSTFRSRRPACRLDFVFFQEGVSVRDLKWNKHHSMHSTDLGARKHYSAHAAMSYWMPLDAITLACAFSKFPGHPVVEPRGVGGLLPKSFRKLYAKQAAFAGSTCQGMPGGNVCRKQGRLVGRHD